MQRARSRARASKRSALWWEASFIFILSCFYFQLLLLKKYEAQNMFK